MIINFLNGDSKNVKALVASAFTEVEYNSSATTIDFYDLDGNVVSSLDASDFVIDGMVEDVYLSGTTLVIDFNTESGQQDIEIDLTDFFNPEIYWTSAQTQSAITEAISTIDLSAAVASANTYTDGEVSALTAHLEDVEQVTASALTTLHTDIIDLSGATAHMVESEDDSVVNVIKISQADYDALVAQSATSITTLYVIIS